jgi:hypothetical protein
MSNDAFLPEDTSEQRFAEKTATPVPETFPETSPKRSRNVPETSPKRGEHPNSLANLRRGSEPGAQKESPPVIPPVIEEERLSVAELMRLITRTEEDADDTVEKRNYRKAFNKNPQAFLFKLAGLEKEQGADVDDPVPGLVEKLITDWDRDKLCERCGAYLSARTAD